MSVFDQIAANVKSSAIQAAANAVSSYLPIEVQKSRAFGAAKDMIEGGGFSHGIKSPILGGLSLSAAKRIVGEAQGQKFARKNLWLLEVSSELKGGKFNIPALFNMFATDVQYSPAILSGDPLKIGGANFDTVTGLEPCELSITTLDDSEGTIKKWFLTHHRAAVSTDGTFIEPGNYAIKVRIVHGDIEGKSGHFETVGLFRPTSIECTLSRTEDGMEEVQMQFAQLDTFMRP